MMQKLSASDAVSGGRVGKNLIQRVRSLPQFNHFLRPAPFHQLVGCQQEESIIINAAHMA